MSLELYDLPGGLYPRRVLIYLSEKHLLNHPLIKITPVTQHFLTMSAPGKPPGSVPILALGDGRFIKQSLAIIEYFEDICDAANGNVKDVDGHEIGLTEVEKEVGKAGGPSMRGDTAPAARARTREVMALVDEASTHFSVACHKGSAMFALLERQDAKSSSFAMESCKKVLAQIESCYIEDGRFNEVEVEEGVNIADCVLFALLQFAKRFYCIDLVEEMPGLRGFYEEFEKRDSAEVGAVVYDENLKAVASHFIEEKETMWGRLSQVMSVVGVYLWVCVKMLGALSMPFWRRLGGRV